MKRLAMVVFLLCALSTNIRNKTTVIVLVSTAVKVFVKQTETIIHIHGPLSILQITFFLFIFSNLTDFLSLMTLMCQISLCIIAVVRCISCGYLLIGQNVFTVMLVVTERSISEFERRRDDSCSRY
jgi:hypothetical protein